MFRRYGGVALARHDPLRGCGAAGRRQFRPGRRRHDPLSPLAGGFPAASCRSRHGSAFGFGELSARSVPPVAAHDASRSTVADGALAWRWRVAVPCNWSALTAENVAVADVRSETPQSNVTAGCGLRFQHPAWGASSIIDRRDSNERAFARWVYAANVAFQPASVPIESTTARSCRCGLSISAHGDVTSRLRTAA